MTTPDSVYSAIKQLPQPMLEEVMDYIEFLQYKSQPKSTVSARLSALKGGLENSKTFDGDPVAIQKELRNEWH